MPKPTFRKKSVDDDNSISKFSDKKISVGDIRKTQVITTFGVGSIVDFKDDTVIIVSTDDWDYPPDSEEVEKRKIFNENLSVITEAEYFLMPKTTQNTNHFSKVKMCGVLIFVSSSDSDSSLGGLISIADNKDIFERIMDSMLDRASWCSGDPLCISSMKQGYKNLNYAACHDCTLLPETSCERFNCFLDRASIVGLPDNPALGFFNT